MSHIRTTTKVGSGGATGSVAWGPNFGEAQELTVGVAAAMPSIGLNGIVDLGLTVSMPILGQDFSSTPTDLGVTAGGNLAILNYLDWANANTDTTGITNPANAIDKDIATFAAAIAAATGIGGITPATNNFDLASSFPDFTTPLTGFTITQVLWEYRWVTCSTGTQVTPGSVSFVIEY